MKLIFSSFDPYSGVSTVALQKGNNIFTGTSIINDEDRDVASSYIGCYFAELKATIKMIKHDYKETKKELIILRRSYQELTQMRDFAAFKHSSLCQHLRKQIRIKEAQVNELKNRYQCIQENYMNIVEERIAASRNFKDVLAQVGQKEIRWKNLGDFVLDSFDDTDIIKPN